MNCSLKIKTIEFTGMPKAGKSTQLELLETILKHKGFNVRNIYEGARVCPLNKKDRFQYNTWSFNNTANRIMEAMASKFDYMLIDRGIYDHIAFTKALLSYGQITAKQSEAQLKYFREFSFLEDIVLIFTIDPKEAMERECKHHEFAGTVMNKEFLIELRKAYIDTISEIKQKHVLIDGSKSIKENKEEILNFIVNMEI
ncbi:MAG: hypothetical protein V1732_06350 [Patescibacteria group bacterium]